MLLAAVRKRLSSGVKTRQAGRRPEGAGRPAPSWIDRQQSPTLTPYSRTDPFSPLSGIFLPVDTWCPEGRPSHR